eukprot:1601616-Pleurochrysis_carterae.AAC.2
MADPPPCSSNGDAAASLMNMFKDMKPPTVPAAASAPSAPASAASSPTAAQNPKIPARDSSARDDDIFKSSPNAGRPLMNILALRPIFGKPTLPCPSWYSGLLASLVD